MPEVDISPEAVVSPAAAAAALTALPVRPRRPGHGLVRLLVFGALVFVLAAGFDRLVSSGLHRIHTSKFGSFNRVVAGEVNADVIINGSSRALTHYDPRVINRTTGLTAYNLGMNGTQSDVQAAILKTYLRHNRAPKLVIQNLEAFSFEATRPGEIYDPGFYLPYLDEPDLYPALCRIDPAVWRWKHIPLYGYAVEDMRFTWIGGVLGWLGYNGREDYIEGFTPRALAWTGDFEHFRSRVRNGVTYRIERRGVEALLDIVRTCQARNIPLILVFSPEYREMQELERNRPEIIAQFQRMARQFGIEFWDYSDSPLCLSRDNFYNSQHLNAHGAEAFSRDLARRLAVAMAEQDSRTAPLRAPRSASVVKNR